MINAEFWVAVAFVLFVAFAIYMGLHRTVLEALDQRAARIKAELDEAVRLKRGGAEPCSRSIRRRSRRPSGRPRGSSLGAEDEEEVARYLYR